MGKQKWGGAEWGQSGGRAGTITDSQFSHIVFHQIPLHFQLQLHLHLQFQLQSLGLPLFSPHSPSDSLLHLTSAYFHP